MCSRDVTDGEHVSAELQSLLSLAVPTVPTMWYGDAQYVVQYVFLCQWLQRPLRPEATTVSVPECQCVRIISLLSVHAHAPMCIHCVCVWCVGPIKLFCFRMQICDSEKADKDRK